MNAGLILFLIFILCLVIGVPVSISLSVASLAAVVFGGLPASSTAIAQGSLAGCSPALSWPLHFLYWLAIL